MHIMQGKTHTFRLRGVTDDIWRWYDETTQRWVGPVYYEWESAMKEASEIEAKYGVDP